MTIKQKTIKKALSFTGIGVHSGKQATVCLQPAGADHGVVLLHKDMPDQKMHIGTLVPEAAMHATVLRQGKLMISTVEHLMAALHALNIDNVLIEIDSFEVPILDGSALPFMHKLLEIGTVEYSVAKKCITPKKTLTFCDDQGRKLIIHPADKVEDGLYLSYEAEFEHKLAGKQHLEGLITPEFFLNEVAPARTFGFLEQLPLLRKHGLAQGSSLGNTVVIGPEGYMNEVRFKDEFVRHKFLDLLGDLFLVGYQLIGKVEAYKTGHSFNRLVVQSVLNNPQDWVVREE